MAKDITDKAKQFCEEYVKNGYNARQAYITAYWQEDELKASASAYQLLKDTRVQDFIDTVEWSFRITWYKAGISKETIVKVLKDMLEAEKVDTKWVKSPDWTARHNAILDFTRLTGDLKEKKTVEISDKEEVEDNLKDLSFTELLEKRNKVLKAL